MCKTRIILPIALCWMLILAAGLFAQDITGKWAGYIESPGSNAAMRLYIGVNSQGVKTTRLIMNVYGEETLHAIEELKVSASDISFKTEMSKEKFTFTGKISGAEITGTWMFVSGAQTYNGKWKVRKFDDRKLSVKKISPRGGNELPKPTGPHAIGRRSFIWTDESRDETITEDPHDKRTMRVQIWYPAEPTQGPQRAAYIENLDELYATAGNLSIVRGIVINARENAAPLGSSSKFPLIVFAPGLGESISTYTGIIENLVSHGYAVVAFNPGFDAGSFKMPDGRTIAPRSDIWEQEISSSWTAEKRRAFYDDRRRGWAGDMLFVMDRLTKLEGDLRDRFDTDNAGALGHSFGGQALTIACADDKRFKACANLDGLAQGSAALPNVKGEYLKQPFAFFTKTPVVRDYELELMGFSREEYDARERTRMLELWKPSFKSRMAALEQGAYLVVVRGATHSSYSDSQLLLPPPGHETLADVKRRAEIINEYILAFFDKFQRGRPQGLFDVNNKSQPNVVIEFLKK